ncbi:aldehyde dehydrogenase [Pterulicium gracile]|uniref:Aldehyde dehydrogenase n=1 Tax=Pterulicium gracile TaxID=1884261 RepID=A0A5C3QC39_9AGAR|nr:aldehyde dehydrogenase [Pterula gracilis]
MSTGSATGPLTFTPVEEIPNIRENLRSTFKTGKTRPLAWRRQQLRQLALMMQENRDALADSLWRDLHKPKEEVFIAEIGAVMARALESAEKLEEWAKPESLVGQVEDWQKDWNPRTHHQPKGTVLVIAPWNYPIILTLQPFMGAVAAGCCAVIKPSELAPTYAALLADLLPKYLDPSCFQVVNAEIEGTTKLLELQWDHIVYTGNGKIGRVVASAAAKHLTPVTLELGGKSPVIIDPASDLRLAAKRTLYGKYNNAGQICVAPDYVLIPTNKQDEFVGHLKEIYEEFFPDEGRSLSSESFGHIVNETHYKRVKALLDATNGDVVIGGRSQPPKGIELTVINNVQAGDSLMEEEIFGPLLPIVPVDDLEAAIQFVNDRDHPLILYLFTQNDKVKDYVLDNTTSGGLCINDTFQQLSVNMPFGGVGESGYGRQVLRYGFESCSNARAYVDVPKEAEQMLGVRYLPYNEQSRAVINGLVVGVKIPT